MHQQTHFRNDAVTAAKLICERRRLLQNRPSPVLIPGVGSLDEALTSVASVLSAYYRRANLTAEVFLEIRKEAKGLLQEFFVEPCEEIEVEVNILNGKLTLSHFWPTLEEWRTEVDSIETELMNYTPEAVYGARPGLPC